MKRIAPVVLLLVAVTLCSAAMPEIVWEKYFDGLESEKLLDIEAAPDGGIILLGEIIAVDSVMDSRQFTSSVPFLVKTDALGETLWHHYYSGFWDARGEREDLKILSVGDSGVVFGGEKRNAIPVFADANGALKDLPSFQQETNTTKDTTAVSFFHWETSKLHRSERKPDSGPRIVDSLDFRFMWTGANRELIRERTITLQWRPSTFHRWESGDIIIQGTARQPVTEIRKGINAMLWLNTDMTTRWMRYYDDPEGNGFWPEGDLVCTPEQRLFVFSNPSYGDWRSSFHIVEIDPSNGAQLFSHGFNHERMHIVDYVTLSENEFILAGVIFDMLPDNEHIDQRRFDYWLMKVRLP